MGPWIGAALAGLLGGYAPMFVLLGAVGVLATLISLAATPTQLPRDRHRPDPGTPETAPHDPA
jgi:hypothetical protein